MLRFAVVANVATLAALTVLFAFGTDAWWLATVLAYAPAWPWLLPTLLLAPFAFVAARRRAPGFRSTLALLAAALALWALGVAALALPFGPRAEPGPTLRVLTYNMGLVPRDGGAALRALLAREHIDVALLQECRMAPDDPAWRGWYVHSANLLCVLSRTAPLAIVARDPSDFWAEGGAGMMTRITLAAPFGDVTLVNLHLETPRTGFEALRAGLADGKRELERVAAQREREAAEVLRFAAGAGDTLVLAGDFNAVPASVLLRRHFPGFVDAWAAAGLGFGHTKLTRWHGVRIDRVLLGPALAPARARMLDSLGGDHRPLLVEIGRRQRSRGLRTSQRGASPRPSPHRARRDRNPGRAVRAARRAWPAR